jgi:hypothetical protein
MNLAGALLRYLTQMRIVFVADAADVDADFSLCNWNDEDDDVDD